MNVSPWINYKNNILHVEDVSVIDCAKTYGTPLYIYSKSAIVQAYREVEEAFKDLNMTICFSIKSNSNQAILKTLVEEGSGCDVVSEGEIIRALRAGCDPKKIVFAGVGKTTQEIVFGLEKGIKMFNVESFEELIRIQNIAKGLEIKAPVALRINPNVDAKTHKHITTGKKENKFGLTLKRVIEALKSQDRFDMIQFLGIHVHIGSQITSSEPFITSFTKLKSILDTLKQECQWIPQTINIGGGIGIQYEDSAVPSFKDITKDYLPILKEYPCTEWICEPGRFIIGNAGILVTEVEYIKKTPDNTFAIVNAGMNDLLRPVLYGAYQKIESAINRDCKETYTVVGPICESGDCFGKSRELSYIDPGDFVVIRSAGAYAFSMSSQYNSRRRPSEIMIENSTAKVIRRRETFEDLFISEVY